jgi:hypothetical protein
VPYALIPHRSAKKYCWRNNLPKQERSQSKANIITLHADFFTTTQLRQAFMSGIFTTKFNLNSKLLVLIRFFWRYDFCTEIRVINSNKPMLNQSTDCPLNQYIQGIDRFI